MINTKHTPAPYFINDVRGRIEVMGAVDTVAIVGSPEFTEGKGYAMPDEEIRRDNAAFIVRACNAHEALVEALDDALGALEAMPGYLPAGAEPLRVTLNARIERARTALKMAREGVQS